ncbi:sulfite exporter TauE/SafE family protein [Tautonia sociabilis]|uniref:Probable membrane transporter protein n=2 Tax=Tautonia sociabilis TaxID=2080755 RepID=A0A432MJC6_9BACT|nr:sulfite exporter TauE/SafE family protein [Tautonia sociabilis]
MVLAAALLAASPGIVPEGLDPARVALSLLFGTIVGFSLGLTGGGGSIFAVPLLVYGLGVVPNEAVGVSLAAVGATALFGCLHRLRAGEVEVGTGLIFAGAGMVGAPIGSWIGAKLPGTLLLLLFSGLMLVVAARMWRKATTSPDESRAIRARTGPLPSGEPGPTCRRDPSGRLTLSTPCAVLLSGVGLITGILSGLFGVGGGFVIVPALVFFSGMGVHRAVATSLLVIALIGASGVFSSLAAGRPLAIDLTVRFVLGGLLGMGLGTRVGRRLSGPKLQKLFAVAILLVAVYVVARSLSGA